MDTRSKKRKESLLPRNPYQRTFTKRRKNSLSLNRSSSSSSSPSPHVKDLRARRIFSPDPNSHAKRGINGAGGNQKETNFDTGLPQNDDNNQIKEKLDLKVDLICQIVEKDIEFEVGVVDKDPIVEEIRDLRVIEELNREYEAKKDCDEVSKDLKVFETDVAVKEGDADGLVKSTLKSGSLVRCPRRKVYKNLSSFSYKRMLPFLMDLAKDDTNAPQVHPCQKVDKSVEEMPPASLSIAQEILVDTTEKGILSDGHPVDDSHTSPNTPLSVECSNMESTEHHILETTTPKSLETPMPCTVGNFAIRDLPRLFGEIASQSLKGIPDRFNTPNDALHFVHDVSPPAKSPLTIVIPVYPIITEENTDGSIESGSHECERVHSTPLDGDTCKDYALASLLSIKSDQAMNRCMSVNEKELHPNSAEIGSFEGEFPTPDGDASCKLGSGTGKDCTLESHLNTTINHELTRCMDDNEKDNQQNSVEIRSNETEWIQSTPPDSDALCKLGPRTVKDCFLEGQLSTKSDLEKNRCMGGDEKDRHPNSKAKLGILFPSSRMRLYKAPGSFSYRRLLPYLMDLSRQDTNTLGALPCKNIDKLVDEMTPSSLASQDRQKSEPSKQTMINAHSLGGNGSPHTEPAEMTSPTGSSTVVCTSLGSHKDTLVASASPSSVFEAAVQEPVGNSVSEVQGAISIKPSCMHVESASKIQEETVNESKHVKRTQDVTCNIPNSNLLTESSLVLANSEGSLLKEGSTGPCLLFEEVSDVGSIVLKTTPMLKSPGDLGLIHEQSYIESPVTLMNPSSGSSMGILKKYPLGCRGICTCLNCSSFRLHAERAFEFSRNQMQDTEEVTTELMKELSSIRALLGHTCDGAESRVNLQVPEVKEACTKALRTEEWAKRQLEQMYQELNIHCRVPGLPRPKVRFAANSQIQTPTIEKS